MTPETTSTAGRTTARGRRRGWRSALLASAAVLAAGAADAAELPLTRVVLSTSGLAQFTHSGKAAGGSAIDLTVRLDQVDDLLKSLTVFDTMGAVGPVSLPGREPLDQLFRDLPFGRDALSSPTKLVDALIGSEVEIKGPVEARGRVLKVETETVQLPDGKGTTSRHRLSLLTAQGLVQAIFEDITALSFTDPATRAQIDRALAGLVENRAKDRRRLTINLAGDGTRDVAVGYVVAAPIWKTSWRLVLPKDGNPAGKARLQGWAILENLTGGDWTDVDLTLVSGNPVALHQSLYTAVYGSREEVPLAGTGAPSTQTKQPAMMQPAKKAQAPRAMAAPVPSARMGGAAGMAAEDGDIVRMAPIAETVAARGEETGTQLLYRFPSKVTLVTGHTLMLPFVDREVAASRVWLYRPWLDPRHPWAAAEVENDGDAGLPAGIVTAFDTGSDGAATLVGDAMLPMLPRGDKRLLTFALDTKSDIRREDKGITETRIGTAIDGRLTLTTKSRRVYAYEIKAPAEEDRDVVIEEARADGWMPAATVKDVETTPTTLRWHLKAAKGTTAKGELVLEHTDKETVELASLAPDEILAQVSGLENASPALKDAVARLGDVVAEIAKAETQKNRNDGERRKIAEDQDRIRKNLASAGSTSDLGRRYLDTLRRQEDRLAELAKADDGLDTTIAQRRKAAEDIAKSLKF